jgi:hypothetical protein
MARSWHSARARYWMDYTPRHSLRQVVYPYVEGGPVTFTPRGQHLGQDYESFRGGWYSSGPRLLRLLVAHGFPPKDPGDPLADDSEGQDPKSAASTATESGTWNRWSLTVGALLSLILKSSRNTGHCLRCVPNSVSDVSGTFCLRCLRFAHQAAY